jgi:hypothetical protein
MTESLRDFLIDLACDPKRMQHFIDDPESELRGWRQGLTDDEIKAVKSRDPEILRRALGFSPPNIPTNHVRRGGRKDAIRVPKKKATRRPARKRKSRR